MKTFRGRLAAWYTAALLLALGAFAALLYLQLEAPNPRELDGRITLEGRVGERWLEESYRVVGDLLTGRVAVEQPGGTPARVDSLVTADSTLDPSIGAYFESFTDYVMILDRKSRIIYLSESARRIGFAGLDRLLGAIPPTLAAVGPASLELPVEGGGVRYTVVPVEHAGPSIGAVLIATPLVNTTFDPGALIRAMLAVSPFVVLGAALLAWALAGTALAPVRSMMDELDAIRDGRSLHRRLPVPLSGDEMARFALTLNGLLARLEQSFGSLHRFTADASHELKTPLMVLRAGVERALTHPRTPAEVMETLDETLQQVHQMTEMVENLLTLARADEGRAPLTVEPRDLREFVADAAETAGLLAEAAEVEVETEVPDQPVMLPVDPHRIRELLHNLTINAVKYTPAGGRVSIELRDEPAAATLVVRDTGIGIAPGDLPHIFERFWRADVSRSRAGGRPGVGLGLAISKWIAEAHGGTITVQSRPGRGTVFTVRLPRSEPPVPAA